MNSAAIARALVHQVFKTKGLLMVPETYWAGSECDLLVVEPGLRLIDIEVKISRSDFKRDAAKEKWWVRSRWVPNGPPAPDRPLLHPRRIWKHYFALPTAIWKPELAEFLPSPASGVLTFRETERGVTWRCERRAKPDRKAETIDAADALDIARLAGLRMWDAYTTRDNAVGEAAALRRELSARQTEPA